MYIYTYMLHTAYTNSRYFVCVTYTNEQNLCVYNIHMSVSSHFVDLLCVCNTHMSVFLHSVELLCICTGWRRLIGSFKLQIIFHKRATKYRSFLRKMTYKDKGSYESSPLCNTHMSVFLHFVELRCVCTIHMSVLLHFVELVCVCKHIRINIHLHE